MTIKGLTDRGLSFPQIGNIRKGGKKDYIKNGQTVSAPVDLTYFKVDFDERETDAIQLFTQKYHNEPTELNIRLPFNDITRCWDAWCEAYTAGRMVARSDGEFFVYKVNIQTGAVEVVNGEPKVPHVVELGVVGRTMVKCKPVGRLKVIVPELNRLAYLVVHTTSIIDIRNISEQLGAIQAVNGGRIVGIPLILKRRPKEISVPKPDGSRVRLTKWMLSIEADPSWVLAKLAALDIAALPSGFSNTSMPLLENAITENDLADEDETQIPDDFDDGALDGEFTSDVATETEAPTQDDAYQKAIAITDSKGAALGLYTDEHLSGLVKEIDAALLKNGLNSERKAELRAIKDAANLILKTRNQAQ